MQFIFKDHYKLQGLHAPFSPSQSSWLRYDVDKAVKVYKNKKAAERGTRLHEWAKTTIDLGIKQARSRQTLCAYVNDAIGFRMKTEVVLYYSDRIFGTADAISFRKNSDGVWVLRIHDLKTGAIKADIEQLEVYAALFCLEYNYKPEDIIIELRIYQDDDILVHSPEPEDISQIMNHIVQIDKPLEKIDYEEA